MSFTDKDKRILIEVINNIHHAYGSDEAFKQSESTSITLPARLLSLSADAVGQSYRPAILASLKKLEIELLLTSLFRSVDVVKTSLEKIMTSLPNDMPDWVRRQREEQVMSIATFSGGPLPPTNLPGDDRRNIVAGLDPASLVERHQQLVEAQQALNEADLDQLREQLYQLEAVLGPRQQQMEQLRNDVSVKTAELEKLTTALSAAENVLQGHDRKVRDRFDQLLNVAGALLSALDPYLSQTEGQIREAVEAVAEKVSRGKHLKQELVARITEVSKVLEETERLSTVLGLYTQANDRVMRSVPTVINVTKEKLKRVEEQLTEIDSDLKHALEQHQKAKHVGGSGARLNE